MSKRDIDHCLNARIGESSFDRDRSDQESNVETDATCSSSTASPTNANGASAQVAVSVSATRNDPENTRAVGAAGVRPIHEPSVFETVAGLAAIVGWTVLFAVGVVLPSEPYRTRLTNLKDPLAPWEVLREGFLFIVSYTVTNVAVLCCLAATVGELGRRTRIGGIDETLPLHRGDYVAAIMRGFLAYLLLLSGFVIIANRQFVAPTAEEYIRMAGAISILGFLAGYNPALFRFFESRFETTFKVDSPGSQGKTGVHAGPAVSLSTTTQTFPGGPELPISRIKEVVPASADGRG
jgi:hypothetical protein